MAILLTPDRINTRCAFLSYPAIVEDAANKSVAFKMTDPLQSPENGSQHHNASSTTTPIPIASAPSAQHQIIAGNIEAPPLRGSLASSGQTAPTSVINLSNSSDVVIGPMTQYQGSVTIYQYMDAMFDGRRGSSSLRPEGEWNVLEYACWYNGIEVCLMFTARS